MRARLRALNAACLAMLAGLCLAIAPAKDPCDTCMERLFSRPAPELARAVTLRDAFERIGASSGVPVRGLWVGKVPAGGLDPDRICVVEGSHPSCGALLNAILDSISAPADPALWQCASGGIEAGLRSALWRPQAMRVRIYDVRDLLLRAPAFRSTGVPQVGGTTAGGSSGGSTGSGGDTHDSQQESRGAMRTEELMRLIQTTVEPDAWTAMGGPCTMAPRDGLLVVRAPEFVHRQIERPRTARRTPPRDPPSAGAPKTP